MNAHGAALALLALLLTTGCQRSLFESLPGAVDRCDSNLVGDWLSRGDDGEPDGELVASIDASCSVVVVEQRREGERRSQPSTLRMGKLGRNNLLGVDATWANESFEVHPDALDQPGDLYLFAYRLRGTDQLTLLPVRHRELAELAVRNKLEADVILRDGSLTVRVSGDSMAMQDQLRRVRLFVSSGDTTLHFRRQSAETP